MPWIVRLHTLHTALLPASRALDLDRSFPAVLERAGRSALFAADEFFGARIDLHPDLFPKLGPPPE